MSNPDPKAQSNEKQQAPFQWFQEAYPFVDGATAGADKAHEDEFILLQKLINSGAKNRVRLKNSEFDQLFDLTNYIIDVLQRPQAANL